MQQKPEAMEVIKKKAEEMQAELIVADITQVQNMTQKDGRYAFEWKAPRRNSNEVCIAPDAVKNNIQKEESEKDFLCIPVTLSLCGAFQVEMQSV